MKSNIKLLEGLSRSQLKPVVIKNVNDHTMENNIYKYLEIKMHHLINKNDYQKILVIGEYNRNKIIGNNEKNDKIFNWQRPTAEAIGKQLIIYVPTGKDYIQHYASLIASYLAINNRSYENVYYIEPHQKDCEMLIIESNISKIKIKEIVIIGFGLINISNEKKWKGNGSFLYKNVKIGSNQVTLLGCKHSLWGDIARNVTKYLANELGVKTIIYIGKLGSLNKEVAPNKHLATGSCSYINGKKIQWTNLFDQVQSPTIIKGSHITSPSLLIEDKEWLQKNKEFDFVDPEIGQFAKGAIESGINFSYLHIISNNLTDNFNENLSNERDTNILEKREKLLAEIESIISKIKLPKTYKLTNII